MTITANRHPYRVTAVGDSSKFANRHPIKVAIEGVEGGVASKADIERLEEEIALLEVDLTFKGEVETEADLPSGATIGDVYFVKEKGSLYVYTGEAWRPMSEGGLDPLYIIFSGTTTSTVTRAEFFEAYTAKRPIIIATNYNFCGAIWYPNYTLDPEVLTGAFSLSVPTMAVQSYQPSSTSRGPLQMIRVLKMNIPAENSGFLTIDDVYGTDFYLNEVDNLESTAVDHPLSANQGRVLNEKIEQRVKENAGAPTASTEGTVGSLLEDTTNGELYQLKSIDTSVTPNIYNWEKVGSGGTQSDYDINDSSDPAYIKNRPFFDTNVSLLKPIQYGDRDAVFVQVYDNATNYYLYLDNTYYSRIDIANSYGETSSGMQAFLASEYGKNAVADGFIKGPVFSSEFCYTAFLSVFPNWSRDWSSSDAVQLIAGWFVGGEAGWKTEFDGKGWDELSDGDTISVDETKWSSSGTFRNFSIPSQTITVSNTVINVAQASGVVKEDIHALEFNFAVKYGSYIQSDAGKGYYIPRYGLLIFGANNLGISPAGSSGMYFTGTILRTLQTVDPKFLPNATSSTKGAVTLAQIGSSISTGSFLRKYEDSGLTAIDLRAAPIVDWNSDNTASPQTILNRPFGSIAAGYTYPGSGTQSLYSYSPDWHVQEFEFTSTSDSYADKFGVTQALLNTAGGTLHGTGYCIVTGTGTYATPWNNFLDAVADLADRGGAPSVAFTYRYVDMEEDPPYTGSKTFTGITNNNGIYTAQGEATYYSDYDRYFITNFSFWKETVNNAEVWCYHLSFSISDPWGSVGPEVQGGGAITAVATTTAAMTQQLDASYIPLDPNVFTINAQGQITLRS